MPKGLLQRLLPHLIAVIIFLIIAVVYCKPVLEGRVVTQHDIAQWQGAFHQSEVYKETHGHYPLWTNALFSGMPTFQIGGTAQNYVAAYANLILTLGLPKPISYFFLACICFYILSIILRVRPYIGILGSLAFAYATYNPVIVSVGHDTKMLSIAYMPAVIGSFLLIFERRYWLGAALAALFTSCIIAMNHLQITYYTFLIVGVMAIFYAIRWVRSKEFLSVGKVAGFAIVALALGVLTNAVNLFSTYEYQKETIRGGGSELAGGTQQGDAKNGLDKEYALSYSMNIAEPFVLMVPRFYGGSSDKLEVPEEESKAIEALRNMPQELAQQLQGNISFYWGGMTKAGEVGTSGPPYSGAIICFLAILSMFLLDGKHKWWAFTAIVLSILMSWGHYFEGFNGLLYKYLPFYNKFRAPSMIMVIPQVLLPMLAVLGVHRIATAENKAALLPSFKKGVIATGAVFAVLFLLYFSLDFLSGNNKEIMKQVRAMNQPQMTEMVQSFFNALVEDRKSLMMGDILRSFGFILVAAGLVFFALRNVVKPLVLSVLLTVAAFIDVMTIDVKYLNSDNYKEQEENTIAFQRTQADEQLMSDKSFYRVFSVSSPFTDNTTSYYYNSIAGYHPAKLRIYQDLIEQQLQKQPMNEKVLDMLNTKYFIQKDQNGQTQAFQQRPTALGNAWFVKAVRFVPTAEAEMRALDNLNAKDTAVIREAYRSQIGAFQFDSSAAIQLVKNDNDIITYRYNAPTSQLAVFSEIFYDKGWKAFVDGKETPILKADYVLRAMVLPAGSHNIEFRFEPKAYLTGKTIALITTIALLLMLGTAVFFIWKRNRQA
jgi:hypothetical protein